MPVLQSVCNDGRPNNVLEDNSGLAIDVLLGSGINDRMLIALFKSLIPFYFSVPCQQYQLQ